MLLYVARRSRNEASTIVTISSMPVLTASPRRKSIACRIRDALSKSYLYSSFTHAGSFRSGILRFSFAALFDCGLIPDIAGIAGLAIGRDQLQPCQQLHE